jgi:hypothetical protein
MQSIAPCAALILAAAAALPAQNSQATPQPAAVPQPKPAPAAAPKPDPVKPFAELIKDATEIAGVFRLYRTAENKVYMELVPEHFEKTYLLSLTCDSAIGERGIYAAEMCGHLPVLFRRLGKNSVQIIGRNSRFRADEGTPMARAVKRSFSDSVLGLAPVVSQPHPDRKSVLIDLGALFLTDLPMYAYRLEASFRMPYRFDARNSSFGAVKAFEGNVEIETTAHYAAERPPVPPLTAPGAPSPPRVAPPRSLADVRSMLLKFRYSISELPDSGYRPRIADDRVGHFFVQINDYSDRRDHKDTPAVRYVNRWRLEKADPAASLSRPKKPIVFWLENTIPEQYRAAVREGVLMWNKAFERIGLRDAVEVRQQPDGAEWDAADVRYNTIRWFAGMDAGFAQGPSRANPFTGEIYDADIRFSEVFTRAHRQTALIVRTPLSALPTPWPSGYEEYCTLMSDAVAELAFGVDVLAARDIEPDSPEATRFVDEYLRWISAHEVGHTLGLRHNFRSSSIRPITEMHNPEITASEGLIGSVMDYTPPNIAAKGEKQGEFHQSTLGPYDYWAIEYAYKPIDAATPEDELPELRKIASRAADPMLAYGTDEDAGVSNVPLDLDPLANRFDLGADPLQYYAHRVRLSREIWENMEAKLEKPGEGYQVLRRSFDNALGQLRGVMLLASKYVGGVYHHRDHIGDANARLPYQPVPALRQKQALQLISENCFAPKAFQFSPALINKLNIDRFPDRFSANPFGGPNDPPVHDNILSLQRAVLERLFHPVVLKRMVDNEMRYATAAERFRLSELFRSLQAAVWADAQGSRPDINSMRRNLQREHLRRMLGMLLRDGGMPEDARTMARHSLQTLRQQLRGTMASAGPGMPVETRAHLSETIARIDESLNASMQRTAF